MWGHIIGNSYCLSALLICLPGSIWSGHCVKQETRRTFLIWSRRALVFLLAKRLGNSPSTFSSSPQGQQWRTSTEKSSNPNIYSTLISSLCFLQGAWKLRLRFSAAFPPPHSGNFHTSTGSLQYEVTSESWLLPPLPSAAACLASLCRPFIPPIHIWTAGTQQGLYKKENGMAQFLLHGGSNLGIAG